MFSFKTINQMDEWVKKNTQPFFHFFLPQAASKALTHRPAQRPRTSKSVAQLRHEMAEQEPLRKSLEAAQKARGRGEMVGEASAFFFWLDFYCFFCCL